MNLVFKNEIKIDEFNAIRKAVGFRQIHPEQVQASIDGSAFIIAAYHNDEAIGMARLIWDTSSVALIHDLIVVPAHQLKGIEKEMITRIFSFLKSRLKPGFGIQIDVRAWNRQESFYEELGFKVSTPDKRGVPMHICLTDQIELTDEMFQQS